MPFRSTSHAFTLLELLVATAVFALLMVVIFGLVEGTSKVTTHSNRRLDVDAISRQTLDRMGFDIQQMVLRPDLPGLFEKLQSNDRMTFFVMGDGYEGDRGISKISYFMENGKFRRGAEGKYWSHPQGELTFQPVSVSSVATQDSEVVSENIFRFEMAFLMRDGSIQAALTNPHQLSSSVSNANSVGAIIIAIVALDPRAKILLPHEDPSSLAIIFPDAEDGQDILTAWSDALSGADLPVPVKQGIRISQRYLKIENAP